MSPWRLRQIARLINQGALIAYPTDTIWGFGCSPFSIRTIKRLLALKQRSPAKGLILLSPCLEYLEPFIDKTIFATLNAGQLQSAKRPVTWVIKASNNCPEQLTGNYKSVAIRICNTQPVERLCHSMQSALISTSANISGFNSARNSLQIHRHFQHKLDCIIEGFNTGSYHASEIRDFETGKILRS